VQNITAVYF